MECNLTNNFHYTGEDHRTLSSLVKIKKVLRLSNCITGYFVHMSR